MGNWNINISGIGVHNNTRVEVPEDADKMAKQFVKDLKERGHTIDSATFTAGYPEDITEEE